MLSTDVTKCIVCVSGYDPLTFSFLSFSFLTGWKFNGLNYLKCWNLCAGPAASSFPQCPCSSRSSLSSSCCLCIWFRGEPLSNFSMACYSIVSHWCKWCMFIMLPCSQRAFILVLEHVGNFGVRLPPGCSRHGVSVHCLCVQISSFYATRWPVFPTCMQLILVSWYVAISMLCCHCWVFSLSDALPMQSYPSKVWVLCQCGRTDLCAAYNLLV